MGTYKRLLLGMILLYMLSITFAEDVNKTVKMYLFWGNGCPHCAKMKVFLNALKQKYAINVVEYEVFYNKSNRILFQKFAYLYNTSIEGVPTIFIGDKVFVGYSPSIAQRLEDKVKECLQKECPSPIEGKDLDKIKVQTEENNSFSGTMLIFSIIFALIIGAIVAFFSIRNAKNNS